MLLKKSLIAFSICATFMLTGCDLGSHGNKDSTTNTSTDNQTETPETSAANYSLSSQINGLSGTIILANGSQEQTLTTDGTVVFEQRYQSGDNYQIQIKQQPDGQRCSAQNALSGTILSDDMVVQIQCKNFLITGTVIDFSTGNPVSGAQVSNGPYSTTTDASGFYGLTDVVPDDEQRLVLNISGENIADYSAITYLDGIQNLTTANLAVQPVDAKISFDTTQNTTISLPDSPAAVILAANSLVNGQGTPAMANAQAKLTVINPASNPELMPGNYEVMNADGSIANIESFGAIDVAFFDQEGNALNLAPTQTATIRIPLTSNSSTPPTQIPLYYYNDETGYWVEEGSATLNLDDVTGQYYYEGQVAHFTVWNADQTYNSVTIHGCVVDANNRRIANAQIQTAGKDYIGTASTRTNEHGEFAVRAKMNSVDVLLSGIASGLVSNTVKITTFNNDVQLETCLLMGEAATQIRLTWGENPNDLDSHLRGPMSDADSFHIYYSNQSVIINDIMLGLDVDDTDSFGPEIITIPSYPLSGRYYYAVHHYSGDSTITESPANVQVKLKDTQQIFTPSTPFESSYMYWLVFEIQVDLEGNITLIPRQEWIDEATFNELPVKL